MTVDFASRIPGRSIHTYDLLDEAVDTYSLSRETAHEAIHGFLQQIIEIDGAGVILERAPIRPDLAANNPNDRDVHYWLTVSDETADAIRDALREVFGE
ncbi:hypothetical protein [Kitasatospora griseola]|uniref:hypothetical protein n=1 Tax=Kitasatospora griseola TaxID=2064 RepID=UPI00364C51D4